MNYFFPFIHRSGRKRITCKFEKELDTILGTKPTTRPKHVVDTSMGIDDSDDSDDTNIVSQIQETSVNVSDEDSDTISHNTKWNDDALSPQEILKTNTPSDVDVIDAADSAPNSDAVEATPKKHSVKRKAKVTKQKSIADAITFMAESQSKSDAMFLQLEEMRMKMDTEGEERREKMRLDFEMRQMQARQDFEFKRMEFMLKMGRDNQASNTYSTTSLTNYPNNHGYLYMPTPIGEQSAQSSIHTQATHFGQHQQHRYNMQCNGDEISDLGGALRSAIDNNDNSFG